MSARAFAKMSYRPRYADVAATLALVFAMGGTAYAVTALEPNSVYTAAIQKRAVTAPKIATGAVSNTKIAAGAVTGGKVAEGAITGSKVAANAITGGKVLNHSLTVADLAGSSHTGSISFSLSPNGCGNLLLSVPGAKVGQMAVFNWVGTDNPPAGVMIGPLKVTGAGRIVASACNLTDQPISKSGLNVRVTTLS